MVDTGQGIALLDSRAQRTGAVSGGRFADAVAGTSIRNISRAVDREYGSVR